MLPAGRPGVNLNPVSTEGGGAAKMRCLGSWIRAGPDYRSHIRINMPMKVVRMVTGIP